MLTFTYLSFCITENSQLDERDFGHVLPDSVLLESPALPSALQVFASVGGLALLAEHLPLLYPEVSRQVSPPAPGPSHPHPTPANIASDWVTVESSDFSFEVGVTSQEVKYVCDCGGCSIVSHIAR